VEIVVRDGIPILGPILADLNRTAVALLSRPDRTAIETLFSAGLTPLPKVLYDIRYDYLRAEKRFRVNYLLPAREELATVRAKYKGNEAMRQKAVQEVYRKYPWLRPVESLYRGYSDRLGELINKVREYRRAGDYERAQATWRQYNDLKKQRLRDLTRLLKTYGIKLDY